MAVYVDDARLKSPKLYSGKAAFSHLTSDTRLELHAFAKRLGLQEKWFQDHPRLWHYDVTETKRVEAIAMGAIPISVRDSILLARARINREEFEAAMNSLVATTNLPQAEADRLVAEIRSFPEQVRSARDANTAREDPRDGEAGRESR